MVGVRSPVSPSTLGLKGTGEKPGPYTIQLYAELVFASQEIRTVSPFRTLRRSAVIERLGGGSGAGHAAGAAAEQLPPE